MALTAALLLLAGCSSDPGTPPVRVEFTMEEVAGSYEATRMDASETTTGEVTDLLAAGAEFELTLTDDGRTAGQLFLPEEARVFEEDPQGDLLIDLAGSYTIMNPDQLIDIRLETDSPLFPDDTWAASKTDGENVLLSQDAGLVGNSSEFEITVVQRR